METRLQKVIAASGYCSRRKAETLISQGFVSVNGIVVTQLGTKVTVEDQIEVEGVLINKEEKVYLLFNKPINTICTASDTQGRKTIYEYFNDIPYRLFSCGRLDYETTGLIIITNDGDFANKIMHPSYGIKKTYHATLDKRFDPKSLNGHDYVVVDEKEVVLDELLFVNNDVLITIHEGRKRVVRNLFKQLGYLVVNLHRVKINDLELGNLEYGQYRHLTKDEIRSLINE